MNKLREHRKQTRKFLPAELSVNNWPDIEPYINELLGTEIKTLSDLDNWLTKRSEVEAVLEEDKAWLYINQSCHTDNHEYAEAFSNFVHEIDQRLSVAVNQLNKKLIEYCEAESCPAEYEIFLKGIEKDIELFRDENIPVQAELEIKEQKYGNIAGAMTVNYENKNLTLQQAQNYLKETDRNVRENIFGLIAQRRLKDRDDLDELFNQLIGLRHKLALNAGFKNYLQYRFAQLKRFDYNIEDCIDFHNSVADHVTPLYNSILRKRKNKLKLDSLAPFDLDVDPEGKKALRPFNSPKELINKSILCFSEIDSEFSEFIRIMDANGYLDLDSRKGKAPGGYNYPLYESNVPFIFMNATNNLRDLETMMHEGGHTIHSFLSKDLKWVFYKELPAEIAEVASMSMELISMEHWHLFFNNSEDLKRARISQLEGIIGVLPWIATIDKFQHWIYTHVGHSINERNEAWNKIYDEFHGEFVAWKGFELAKTYLWQKQMHLFQFPLYYIEYGIAQLGAIAIWKNYRENPKNALNAYKKALSLGYSVSIPELFSAAGIKFDFSSQYIKELIYFVQNELDLIRN
ncbi:MAG: M3 family oligoendopeptidase [Bacteroidales bacterium]|nr:M3 family oligoendopeptidase [Bacteroidales bacterium]